VISYGFTPGVDVQGIDPSTDGVQARCRVRYREFDPSREAGEGQLTLAVPGHHNLSNALAAVAIGLEIGLSFERIRDALAEFRGAERRYQVRGSAAGVRVVDDYGHHPTEIAAVLRAARDGQPRRLVVVFQPHRLSRTRDLIDAFGPALSGADVVVLTDIYAAGEAPIEGVTVDALARAIEPHVTRLVIARRLDAVPDLVASDAHEGDLVITLGAGSIAAVAPRILDALSRREARA
jgi:UDP-N-acetylmuramate--alanine ligase